LRHAKQECLYGWCALHLSS